MLRHISHKVVLEPDIQILTIALYKVLDILDKFHTGSNSYMPVTRDRDTGSYCHRFVNLVTDIYIVLYCLVMVKLNTHRP